MGIDTDERQQNINVKKGPMFSKIISGDLLLKQWPHCLSIKRDRTIAKSSKDNVRTIPK